MTFKEYLDYFQSINNTPDEEQKEPYNDPFYIEYTKLNWSRTNRWIKQGKLNQTLADHVKSIQEPQTWLIITEPWCGDAAHNVPFIQMLSELNSNIQVEYELRDSEPFSIENYLTNGTKSIPKLVVRDQEGKDLFTWGPRPAGCQKIYMDLKEKGLEFEEINIEVQKWYNANKGEELQEELLRLFKS